MAATALRIKELKPEEIKDLLWAHRHLEHPSFAARLSNIIGSPIEQGIKLLPKRWYQRLDSAIELSIRKSLDLAIGSMDHITPRNAHINFHRFMAVGTGALGGFFGPITLLAELPIMTALMLRSIADIADGEGEDLTQTDAKLACMEVFALGGRSKEDDAAEAGYYGIRAVISFHFSPVPTPGGNPPGLIPGTIEFVRAIAARFGMVIQDKAAARMIPVAGAVSGALLNVLFMKHFQDVAKGHFIIRRLERKYGSDLIRKVYQRISKKEAQGNKQYSTLEGW
ncbi:MAG: EcsC family protein [Gammaproteobacteria bacterium]|jgi:hypothetical protein